jgi:hypothetical protein
MRTAVLLAAAGLASCGVVAAPAGLASAGPAPAGPAAADSAQNTIQALQSQGYTVNIDRVGSGSLDHCVVTSVRNPNTITQPFRIGNRRDGPSTLIPIIVSKTISVSLDCTS